MDDKSKRAGFSGLAPRAIEGFSHQLEQNGVRIGWDYYWPQEKPAYQFVAVELGILNGNGEAIQVLPTDFAFTYQGEPVKSAQMMPDAVGSQLVNRGLSFMDWLGISGSPAVPHEVVILLPLLLLLTGVHPGGTRRVVGDLLAWRQGNAALKKAAFECGTVPAGGYRHGLLFFKVEHPGKLRPTWREDVGLTIDVVQHRRGPLVAEQAISNQFTPYLPPLPLIVLVLGLQFACLAGSCYGVQSLAWGSANALPFLCGGGYVLVALLALLGLAVDYR